MVAGSISRKGLGLVSATALCWGDARAMGLLMEALEPSIRRFVRARVPRCSPDLLDDLAQDAFVHVIPRLVACRATSVAGLRAWLFTIVQHVVAAHFRSAGIKISMLSSDCDASDGAGDTWRVLAHSHHLESDQQSAAQADVTTSVAGQLAQLVVEAQESLSRETVELLYAHIIDGETWSALAVQLGTTPSGAKRRYQRAQDMLRRIVHRRVEALPPETRAPLLKALRSWARVRSCESMPAERSDSVLDFRRGVEMKTVIDTPLRRSRRIRPTDRIAAAAEHCSNA